jgi:hypothetical protein
MLAASAQPPIITPRPQLYRRFFTPAECELLDACPPGSALSELNLLRVLLSRALAASRLARALSLTRRASMLAAFSATARIIASLVRVQQSHSLGGPLAEFLAALDELDPDDL